MPPSPPSNSRVFSSLRQQNPYPLASLPPGSHDPLSISVYVPLLDISYQWSPMIWGWLCLSRRMFSRFIHVFSIFLVLHSFERPNNTPLCGYATFRLPVQQSTDIWFASSVVAANTCACVSFYGLVPESTHRLCPWLPGYAVWADTSWSGSDVGSRFPVVEDHGRQEVLSQLSGRYGLLRTGCAGRWWSTRQLNA